MERRSLAVASVSLAGGALMIWISGLLCALGVMFNRSIGGLFIGAAAMAATAGFTLGSVAVVRAFRDPGHSTALFSVAGLVGSAVVATMAVSLGVMQAVMCSVGIF